MSQTPVKPADTVPVKSSRLLWASLGALAGLGLFAGLVFAVAQLGGPLQPTGLSSQDAALIRQQQIGELTTPAWVDPQRGVVRVPVESAIDTLAREMAANRAAVNPTVSPADSARPRDADSPIRAAVPSADR